MKANEYQEKALRTASTSRSEDLVLNGVLGLAGESGEVADHVKKALFQGHEIDYDYIADELGDILWYVAIMSKGIGYTLDEIMTMNVEKLKKRYPDGFDSDKSVNRDKK